MGLAGSRWTDEMNRFRAVDELQPGERQNAVLVERGLKGEVEASERLDRGELGHLNRHLDAPILAHRQFLDEQRVYGFESADLAPLDAAYGHVEDFQRARHLERDQIGFDTLDDGSGAHRAAPWLARRRPTAA